MIAPKSSSSTTIQRMTLRQLIQALLVLFKVRVVTLLVFAALGGAFLGANGAPRAEALIMVVITGFLAAGGASAINQYLEQQTDRQMHRTRRRPLAAGTVQEPVHILWLALTMIVAGIAVAWRINPVMALYLGLGALIYVGIYTLWLKPRSMLNIVIGGAAGSMAVMTGGAAVGAASEPGVIMLALIIFLWTPAHFWALAIAYRDDYAAARTPMLPVELPVRHSAWWILIHAVSTGLAAILLSLDSALGWPYLLVTLMSTYLLMRRSITLIRQPERRQAIRLFVTSNIFLAIVLLAIIVVSWGRHIVAMIAQL